jgi:hypothetical protein
MADTKRIRPIWGEFKDQNIDLPVADADQAIADGWAFDPHDEAPREQPPILTDEERLQMEELSAIAMNKARGLPIAEPSKKGAKDKALTADDDSGAKYQTKSGSKSTAKEK